MTLNSAMRGTVKRWAVRLPHSSLPAIGALRLLNHVEACATTHEIWLRSDTPISDSEELLLRQVPAAQRYHIAEPDELIPHGARLPAETLPKGPWKRLRDLVVPQLDAQALPSFSCVKQSLHLVRDDQERPSVGLLTSLSAFAEYADGAPVVRLIPLKFVASPQRSVFIIGSPLPPLAGGRYWEQNGLFIAAGHAWRPAVEDSVVRQTFGLQDNEVAIWHEDGQWDRVDRAQFVIAHRANIRATQRSLSMAFNQQENGNDM